MLTAEEAKRTFYQPPVTSLTVAMKQFKCMKWIKVTHELAEKHDVGGCREELG